MFQSIIFLAFAAFSSSTPILLNESYGKVIDLTGPTPLVESLSNYDLFTPIGITSSQGNIFILNNEDDMKLANASKYMNNIENALYFKESKSMVYYNKTDRNWNQYLFPPQILVKSTLDLIPISDCLSCSTSGGCVIKNSYIRSLTVQDTFGLQSSGQIMLIFGLAYSITSVQRFVFTESIECNLNQGEFGQVYIAPRYIEVGESSVKRVTFKKFKGLIYKSKAGRRFAKIRMLFNEQPNNWCYIRSSQDQLTCSEYYQDEIVLKFPESS